MSERRTWEAEGIGRTERDPAVRRRAAPERVQQMLEPADLVVVEPEDLPEDELLHARVVHAHAPAADLDAVEDEVVVLPAHAVDLSRVQERDVLRHRRRERVVRRRVPVAREEGLVRVCAREQRELGHPEEVRGRVRGVVP
jgi:hypothetical protein